MPGDLHKLWRTRDPKGYHVEYGYSCMGYEIAGGLGVKLAAPEREVYVMVGDGSYLMMPRRDRHRGPGGLKLTIVLVDNHGYASIGALSRSLGHGRLRHALPLPRDGSLGLDGDRSRRRTCRSISPRTRSRWARTVFRRDASTSFARRCEAREAEPGTTVIAIDDRSATGRAGLRELVGRPGGRGRPRRLGAQARAAYDAGARTRSGGSWRVSGDGDRCERASDLGRVGADDRAATT